MSFFSERTARYCVTRFFTLARPRWSLSSTACARPTSRSSGVSFPHGRSAIHCSQVRATETSEPWLGICARRRNSLVTCVRVSGGSGSASSVLVSASAPFLPSSSGSPRREESSFSIAFSLRRSTCSRSARPISSRTAPSILWLTSSIPRRRESRLTTICRRTSRSSASSASCFSIASAGTRKASRSASAPGSLSDWICWPTSGGTPASIARISRESRLASCASASTLADGSGCNRGSASTRATSGSRVTTSTTATRCRPSSTTMRWPWSLRPTCVTRARVPTLRSVSPSGKATSTRPSFCSIRLRADSATSSSTSTAAAVPGKRTISSCANTGSVWGRSGFWSERAICFLRGRTVRPLGLLSNHTGWISAGLRVMRGAANRFAQKPPYVFNENGVKSVSRS